MKFAVWTLGSSRKGPFYPKVIEAESFENAVEKYTGRRSGLSSTDTSITFIVARVTDVVEVTRRRKYEYETLIREYDEDEEDE